MTPEEQLKIIKNNTIDFISDEEFIEKLKEKKQLRVKFGADPSRPDLHLGHAVVMKKLRDFQKLGHKIVLIIGDFTARIGDPTGKSKTRPMLSKEEVFENAKTYEEQVFKILDPKMTEIRFNGEWLDKMNFEDVIRLAAKYTVARMLERDDFNKRYKENQSISVAEFLYPLAQGHDSVAIEADVELGGSDQLFNFLVARKLQEEAGMKPQVVVTLPLLEGTDGHNKMSKSLDNYIAFTDEPKDMFGKVMSIPDTLIIKYMKLLTDLNYKEYEKEMNDGVNPRDIKMILGKEIVKMFYNEEKANYAEQEFINVFRKKDLPDEIPELETLKEINIVELVFKTKFGSKSEIKRLIKQGGIKLNNEKITDFTTTLTLSDGDILKVGKRKFFKIKIC
ncbi:tyrosine--tRNA ligase [Tepiditoga spiralis]|uniref:tyrosine--tRNA ligase n=1 Tax=Tepiditoga spiralis TaxID=2108365 RepID=UPI001687EA5B|nr:tyrosine--tRNA ligase [Tepiditoga spiralis]